MSEYDFPHFQRFIACLSAAVANARTLDEARAVLMMQTDNPAYDIEFLLFTVNMENEMAAFGEALMEPLQDIYGDESDGD